MGLSAHIEELEDFEAIVNEGSASLRGIVTGLANMNKIISLASTFVNEVKLQNETNLFDEQVLQLHDKEQEKHKLCMGMVGELHKFGGIHEQIEGKKGTQELLNQRVDEFTHKEQTLVEEISDLRQELQRKECELDDTRKELRIARTQIEDNFQEISLFEGQKQEQLQVIEAQTLECIRVFNEIEHLKKDMEGIEGRDIVQDIKRQVVEHIERRKTELEVQEITDLAERLSSMVWENFAGAMEERKEKNEALLPIHAGLMGNEEWHVGFSVAENAKEVLILLKRMLNNQGKNAEVRKLATLAKQTRKDLMSPTELFEFASSLPNSKVKQNFQQLNSVWTSGQKKYLFVKFN